LMGEVKSIESDALSAPPAQAQDVHPNAWQLMRISDLLQDARELTENMVRIWILSPQC
jgi:hypothetical protein